MEDPTDYDLIKALVDKFDQNPDLLNEMTEEELAKAAKATSVYGELPNRGEERYSVIALTYLQKEWQNAIALAGSVGYLYSMVKNYEPEPPAELIQGDPIQFRRHYAEVMRAPVLRFLDEHFRFDPDRHVSKFGDNFKIEDVVMPHEPFKGQSDYLAIHGTRIQNVLQEHYFKYPPLINYMMNVYASHLPLKEAEDQYNAAKKLTNIPLYLVQEGRYNLYGDDTRIRNNLDIDAPGNEVLQSVMDRSKKDAELRKELLKKTVRRAKIKNIREMGPDDEGFMSRVRELYPERQINSLSEAELSKLNAEFKKWQMEKHQKDGETIVPMVSIDKDGKVSESALYTTLEQYLKTGAAL